MTSGWQGVPHSGRHGRGSRFSKPAISLKKSWEGRGATIERLVMPTTHATVHGSTIFFLLKRVVAFQRVLHDRDVGSTTFFLNTTPRFRSLRKLIRGEKTGPGRRKKLCV